MNELQLATPPLEERVSWVWMGPLTRSSADRTGRFESQSHADWRLWEGSNPEGKTGARYQRQGKEQHAGKLAGTAGAYWSRQVSGRAGFKPGQRPTASEGCPSCPHASPPPPGVLTSLCRLSASSLVGPVILALPGKGSCPAGEETSDKGSGKGSERHTVTI